MSTVAQVEERKQEKVDFKRILMAADFSAASDRALAHALTIARRFGAGIRSGERINRAPIPCPRDCAVPFCRKTRPGQRSVR